MTITSIFSDITNHIINGMMLYDELAQGFDFLCLDGYREMFGYYYRAESNNYRKISRYFINHQSRLIPPSDPSYKSIIPEKWYNYTIQDITEAEKRNAVHNFMSYWADWEYTTKKMYEKYYKELISIDEAASACIIGDLLNAADAKSKKAERYAATAESVKYDLVWLYSEQDFLEDLYCRK